MLVHLSARTSLFQLETHASAGSIAGPSKARVTSLALKHLVWTFLPPNLGPSRHFACAKTPPLWLNRPTTPLPTIQDLIPAEPLRLPCLASGGPIMTASVYNAGAACSRSIMLPSQNPRPRLGQGHLQRAPPFGNDIITFSTWSAIQFVFLI
jgi:hypothetical protein